MRQALLVIVGVVVALGGSTAAPAAAQPIVFTSNACIVVVTPACGYQLFRVESDGGALRQLTDSDCGGLAAAWQPGATGLVWARYLRGPGPPPGRCSTLNLWKLNADGTGFGPLTTGAEDRGWRPSAPRASRG